MDSCSYEKLLKEEVKNIVCARKECIEEFVFVCSLGCPFKHRLRQPCKYLMDINGGAGEVTVEIQ